MSINKYMKAALKALSNADLDIKSNYKLIRQIERAAKKPRLNFTYNTIEYSVEDKDGSPPAPDVPVRIFTPTGAESELYSALGNYPVIIFFHGGGWVTGCVESYEKMCMTIAKKTRHSVAAAEYRLAPENPFPAALEDCRRTVREIVNLKEEISTARNRDAEVQEKRETVAIKRNKEDKRGCITLMGDSAGGNLAAAVSLYMRDRGEKTADKQILIYPSVYNDHSENSPFPSVKENGTDYLLTSKRVCDYTDLYCSELPDRESPYFAPLLSDNHAELPDTLIITAQYDLLRDEAEEYAKRLTEAGNRVVVRRIANAFHGYLSLPSQFSAVKESYEIINEFLRQGEDRFNG